MIELALTLPVLLVLLMGLMEFGNAFNAHLTIVAAARDGARQGAELGMVKTSTTLPTTTVTSIQNLVEKETERLNIPNSATWKQNTACHGTGGGVCIDGPTQIDAGTPTVVTKSIKVTVCYDHYMIVGIPFFLDKSSPIRMCSQTTMRLVEI